MGLPYTVYPVDVFGEEQFKPEFLRLNPVAKVPVITDHDGPGGKPYTLFESGAILLYLAEKTGQFLPKADAQAAQAARLRPEVARDQQTALVGLGVPESSADLRA